MKESVYSLSEFLLAKDEGRSTIRLFTATPTPLEEKNLGQVFAIMEIESTDSMNEHVLDVVANEINKNYYKSEALEFDSAFEYALQETNKKVQELVGEVGEEWLHNLNMVAGVRKGQDVVFAHLGRVIAQMIHGNNIVDVLDTTASKMQAVNPVRAFGSVMSGRLTPSAILFFSTETILDYLSKEKIKRVLQGNGKTPDSEEAIGQFYDLLSEDTTSANFGAIIIQHVEREATGAAGATEPATIPVAGQRTSTSSGTTPLSVSAASTTQPASGTDSDSMHSLVQNQQKTEELLSGSIWPGVKQSLKGAAKKKPPATEPATAPSSAHSADPVEEADAPMRKPVKGGSSSDNAAVAILKQIGGVLQSIGVMLWNVLKSIVVLVASGVKRVSDSRSGRTPRPSARAPRKPGKAVAGVFAGAVQWFQKLSMIQKIFFVLAIVVLLIFANSVSNRGERQIAADNEAQYSATMAEIDVKINEGKAAIIFDSDTSRTLLLEARDLLATIPTDSESYQERGDELNAVIEEQLLKLNNVITVTDPAVAVDYGSINPDISLSNVIQLGSSMYGFDQSNQSVYRANLESGDTSVTISSSVGPLYNEVVKASPGTGIALLDDQTVATFQPISESLVPVNLEYENTENSFADVEVFGTRLYTLDTRNNQIFRHTGTDGEFAAAEGWITDSSDVSNGVSLAIDGSIYVLRENGSVTRYSAGSTDNDFTLGVVDPALTTADEIYTDENTENLYIIDKSNARVVVFDKNGTFVAQYTSGLFNNLTDIIVDEANSRFYALSGAKLYEIPLAETAAEEGEETTE